MVQCKFFLQGNCRYGASCRFEHNQPVYNHNYNQMLHPQQLRVQPQSGPIRTVQELSELVQKDLQMADRGGQWLLSCYCPLPSQAILLPGMEDHSPEELRCLMYQAQSTGTIEPYRQHIQKLYQDAQSARAVFKSPTQESMAVLEKIRVNPAQGTQANPFQNAPTGSSGGSIFGGTVQTQTAMSVFGGNAPQPSVFGGATVPSANPFGGGSASTANPFGGSSAAPPNPFASGNATQTRIFGGTSPALATPFSGATVAPAAPFAVSPAPAGAQMHLMFDRFPQGSVFGGNSTATATAPAPATATATGSIFGESSGAGQEAMSSFSFAAAAQGIPGTTQNQSFLGSPMPQASPFMTSSLQPGTVGGSIFGGSTQPTAQPAAQPGSAPSIFGGTSTAANVNPFGTPTASVFSSVSTTSTDSSVHTPMSELTEEERAEFMAPTFSQRRIPLRPPPNELCA